MYSSKRGTLTTRPHFEHGYNDDDDTKIPKSRVSKFSRGELKVRMRYCGSLGTQAFPVYPVCYFHAHAQNVIVCGRTPL